MSLKIGDRVKVVKINSFMRGYLKKYFRRIGTISEITHVHPSKRVIDGRVYKVDFPRMTPQKFITQELRKLDV